MLGGITKTRGHGIIKNQAVLPPPRPSISHCKNENIVLTCEIEPKQGIVENVNRKKNDSFPIGHNWFN